MARCLLVTSENAGPPLIELGLNGLNGDGSCKRGNYIRRQSGSSNITNTCTQTPPVDTNWCRKPITPCIMLSFRRKPCKIDILLCVKRSNTEDGTTGSTLRQGYLLTAQKFVILFRFLHRYLEYTLWTHVTNRPLFRAF